MMFFRSLSVSHHKIECISIEHVHPAFRFSLLYSEICRNKLGVCICAMHCSEMRRMLIKCIKSRLQFHIKLLMSFYNFAIHFVWLNAEAFEGICSIQYNLIENSIRFSSMANWDSQQQRPQFCVYWKSNIRLQSMKAKSYFIASVCGSRTQFHCHSMKCSFTSIVVCYLDLWFNCIFVCATNFVCLLDVRSFVRSHIHSEKFYACRYNDSNRWGSN